VFVRGDEEPGVEDAVEGDQEEAGAGPDPIHNDNRKVECAEHCGDDVVVTRAVGLGTARAEAREREDADQANEYA